MPKLAFGQAPSNKESPQFRRLRRRTTNDPPEIEATKIASNGQEDKGDPTTIKPPLAPLNVIITRQSGPASSTTPAG
jgi:hypothetical protein